MCIVVHMSNGIEKTLGQRVAALRGLSSLSARAVDSLVSVSYGYTLKIEKGQATEVSGNTLAAFAELFGVSLDWLVNGTGPEPTARKVKAAVDAAQTKVAS